MMKLTIDGPNHHLEGFMFWWLKDVRDYRLDVHCARCLVGPYDRRINKRMATHHPIELRSDLIYLCGVASTRKWVNNFHVAARLAPGKRIVMPTYNQHTVIIDHAEAIPIVPLEDGYKGLPKSFTTCRNYQFAVQMCDAMTASTSS